MVVNAKKPVSIPTTSAIERPPVDPERRLTHVAHGPVTYTDEGEGPVILLIHGLPGSVRDYRYLAPHLDAYRRIRVDLPGFGGTSRQGRTIWSLEQRAALLVGVLDELRVPRVVAVGHSMGGPIALALATLAPERVIGLGLLASPGLVPHRGFVRSRVPLLSRLMRLPGAPLLLARPLRRGFIAAGFSRNMTADAMTSAIIDAGALTFDAHATRLRRVQLPTLIASADDDHLVESAIAEGLDGTCGAGPRLRWQTGGHNIQKTRAVEIATALNPFVAQCFASCLAQGKAR